MTRLAIRHALVAMALLGYSSAATAADLEAFEFNDAAGTVLAGAANSVNPANLWLEDGGTMPSGMAPSDVRGGVYNIVKGSTVLESNYFQIANITSGTYYLTARLSNWQLENFDATNLEEFRVAFLNDDDANFGTTITAQMTIRRESGGNVLIAGDALGAGATVLQNTAPLPNTQTQPFTATIELNKTSNTYKVFYKDGANPTQVLGIGSVDPSRGGNSVRMAVNNDFSAFNFNYPVDPPVEVMAVDRIALSDTNPFTDLITLEIDRGSGLVTLKNTSGVGLTGLEGYSITSTAGAFDPTKWKTVTGNYDSAGNGSVDNAPWAVTTSSKIELAEMFQSGDGGGLTNNQNVVLSVPLNDTWLKSPIEDVHMTLDFASGPRTVNVNFVGNGGLKWASGDLNFDNQITGADWLIFIANGETDLTGLTRVERYQKGDLNNDGFNNIADFIQFEALYDAANGGGAFAQMLADLSIPEPSSIVLLTSAAALVFGRRRGNRSIRRATTPNTNDFAKLNSSTGECTMPRFAKHFGLLCAAIALAVSVPSTHAAVLEEFTFSEPNDTPLDVAANSVNPANTWILGGASFDPSAVLNGNYRITKAATNLATAHIDMANVTTGKVWLVAEIAGWNYTSTASSPSEEVRFAFLDNDNSPPSGSTITAQMQINRSGAGLALVGNALGTGSTNIAGSYALPLVRSTPFQMTLELDKNLDQYSVYYKDDTNPYQLLGTANLGAKLTNPADDRDGNSIRFAPTGAFNDTGEFFDINRIYLTNTSPIGEVVDPVALTLQVFSNGDVSILNDTDDPISFNSYRIVSPTTDLNFAGWDSLSDQGISAVDGTDPGTTPGDGIGETWDEAGGSDDGVLAESFLLGSTTMAPMDTISLGSAFQPGGDHSLLTFEYRDSGTGAIVVGDVEFLMAAGVDGDFNDDGTVDAADYVVWRKYQGTTTTLPNDNGIGGTVGPAHFDLWRANFGEILGAGSGSSSSQASVPEPAGLILLLSVICASAVSTRRRVP
jgi:hypothetical protein